MHISFINCQSVGAGDCHQTPDNAGILCQFKCHSLRNRSLKVIYINGLGKLDLWVVEDVSPFATVL